MEGESWGNEGPHEMFFKKPSLARQRVRARHRTDESTTVQTKITTTGGRTMLTWWLRRWLPWFATPEGGRL
jgi:hypothetical protein